MYKAIDISKFDYLEDRRINTKERIRIVFVKNDYKRGGLKELSEALGELKEYKFEVNVIGPHDHQKSIIDKYFESKANIKYIFKGKRSQEEVIEHLYRDDILCVPSLREGLGVSNIEGLATGIAVVSTDAGGIPEVLGKGEYGWVSKAGDVQSLSMVLRECIEKSDNNKRMRMKGRAFVSNNFSHHKMIKELLEMIEKTI